VREVVPTLAQQREQPLGILPMVAPSLDAVSDWSKL
jgi:hypothetical protein